MVLEDILDFVKKHRGISSVTLALALTSGTPSYAFLDGEGHVINDGKESYSCNYKNHQLTAHCDYDTGKRKCLPYEILDKKGKKVNLEDLNPAGCMILLDPNTGICEDVEDSCICTDYNCC